MNKTMNQYRGEIMSENAVNYDVGPKQGYARPALPKERHTAGDMLRLLNDEARQLIEETHILRERLAPLLTGEERTTDEKRGTPPAASKLSAELGETWLMVQQARDIVRTIQQQLDL